MQKDERLHDNQQAGTAATTRETRESRKREKPWTPPALLDAPKPPAGYVYRWVRMRIHGDDDPGNISKRIHSGYEPVRAEEIKNHRLPTIEHGRFAGTVGINDVILMKCPREMVDARRKYYEDLSMRQIDAVNARLMQNQNKTMPLSADYRTQVKMGGRTPQFED